MARPQAEVMHALEDLDITHAPGVPGTDPARSGEVTPVFRAARTPTEMIWTVMSGDKVATRMIADFEPVDATHTRVTARVERGDAPDDLVSPAFRSRGVTLRLFGMALKGELDALTAPPEDVVGCARLVERLQTGGFGPGPGAPGERSLTAAMGETAKAVIAINALAGERQRLGCKAHDTGGFGVIDDTMQPADASAPATMRSDDVRIVPGKPMVDPAAAASGPRS